MTVNCNNPKISDNGLFDFLKRINCTNMQFKLLCFWKQHPKTRLGFGTISGIMRIPKDDLAYAMNALVERNIVTRHDINGLLIYSLAGRENQQFIDELIRLDMSEIVQLGKHLRKEWGDTDELTEFDWASMMNTLPEAMLRNR